MARLDPILAIDIGGDSLKVAEFTFPNDDSLVLENFAVAEYGGDLKEEDLLVSLTDALKETISDKKFKAKKVYVSISGQSAFIRFSKLPPVGDEPDRIGQLVEYEARQHMPFAMDKVVWDYQLVKNPEDEDMDVMFVAIKEDFILNITNILEQCKKTIVCVDTAPTACYNCCCANKLGVEDCEMVLNIGGRCSTLVFVDNGRYFVRSIPIAGHSITQQISREFNIPFADAEEMKRRHGFVALGGAYEEPDSEVAATVSKIIRNVMTRLHGEINRSINVYRSQWKGRKPARIWLAGGSSVMAFTPRFFSEKLRINVDYLNPFPIVTLGSNIKKEELIEVAHMFSEVIGLGLRHIAKCPIEISLKPKSVKSQQSLKQKVPYFLASCFTIVLCLVIFLFIMVNLKNRDQERVQVAQEEINKTQKLGTEVKTAKGNLDGIAAQYNDVQNIFTQRTVWPAVINELQKVLPDNMWLVTVKGVASETKTVVAAPKETASPRRSRRGGGGGGGEMMPPGGPGGGMPLFGGMGGGPNGGGDDATIQSAEMSWLRIIGHTLVMSQMQDAVESFKDNLLKTGVFTSEKEDIRLVDYVPARGKMNVTTFTMEIKLKKTITK